MSHRFPGVSLEDSLHAPATEVQAFGLKTVRAMMRNCAAAGGRDGSSSDFEDCRFDLRFDLQASSALSRAERQREEGVG
jgi:hypothetical protein